MLTEPQRRALLILQGQGEQGIRPREFAKAMWPDSPGWQRSVKCGPNGSHRGGGMYTTGGAYLARLVRAGWARKNYRDTYDTSVSITTAGEQALRDT